MTSDEAIEKLVEFTSSATTNYSIDVEVARRARNIAALAREEGKAAAATSLPDVPPGTLLAEERLAEIATMVAKWPLLEKWPSESCEGPNEMLKDLWHERQRLLGLLSDLSLDGATERYNTGWNARVKYGPWMPLGELPNGAIFETEGGIRAVKSEYWTENVQCECILLASGEYAHFMDRNREQVREIIVEGVTG